MIIASRGRDREHRSGGFHDDGVPSPLGRVMSTSGLIVNTWTALEGLPAAMEAIRQPSVLIAGLEVGVFRGHDASKERVEDWRARLLAAPDGGIGEYSGFDFMSDMQSALEGFGNAFALKVHGVGRLRGQVVQLLPIHPDLVWARLQDGRKVFDIHIEGRTLSRLTTADILHIRGFVPGGAFSPRNDVAAPSPVQVHRNPLGNALALDEFQGRYFRDDARPPAIMTFPPTVTQEQAQRWLDLWNAQHRGVSNRGKLGVMGGGGELKTIPISLEDAQFIEGQQFAVEQIARIFNWPAWALDHQEAKETESAETRGRNLLSRYLWPRVQRLQAALMADPDLFGGTGLEPEFLTDKLISIDAATQAEVDHKNIQSGLRLRDEVRADHGWGPLPSGVGQIPVVTPVGAGANPDPLPSAQSQQDEPEE